MDEVTKPTSVAREFGSSMNEWRKSAFGGVWGRIGDVATLLGIAVPAFSAAKPALWNRVIATLHVAGNEALLWEAPVVVGGSILVVRLVLAPFWIVRAERQSAALAKEAMVKSAADEKARLEAERANDARGAAAEAERLQERVVELEQPSPRITVRWIEDAERPIVVKNVGPIEAHRVKVGDLEVGKEYVEFEEVDPLERNEEKSPAFRVLTRGDPVVSVLKMTMFSWFLKHVAEAETWAVWRAAAGLPAVPDLMNDLIAFKETLDLGPPKHPLVVSYTDPSGMRKFETEYRWWVDRGGEALELEFVGQRTVH